MSMTLNILSLVMSVTEYTVNNNVMTEYTVNSNVSD